MQSYSYELDGWITTIYATLSEVMERINQIIGGRDSFCFITIRDEHNKTVATRMMSYGSQWRIA